MTYGNELYREYLNLLTGKKKEVFITISECIGGYNVIYNAHKRGVLDRIGFKEAVIRWGPFDYNKPWGCFYEHYNVLDYDEIRIRTKDPSKFRKLIFELDKAFRNAGEDIDDEIIVEEVR